MILGSTSGAISERFRWLQTDGILGECEANLRASSDHQWSATITVFLVHALPVSPYSSMALSSHVFITFFLSIMDSVIQVVRWRNLAEATGWIGTDRQGWRIERGRYSGFDQALLGCLGILSPVWSSIFAVRTWRYHVLYKIEQDRLFNSSIKNFYSSIDWLFDLWYHFINDNSIDLLIY